MSTHWKQFFDPSEFIGPSDFAEPRTVTIARMSRGKDPEGKTKPFMYFQGKDGSEVKRPMVISSKSVMFALAQVLGSDVDQWPGKEVTFAIDECISFGAPEECIRPVTTPEIEARILKMLKKKKVNPGVWRSSHAKGKR